MFCLLGLIIAAPSIATPVGADSTVMISGSFITTDVGEFTVGLSAKPAGGCGAPVVGNAGFGPYSVDAVGQADGVTSESLNFCVLYVDTQTNRGPFTVQLSINSFELTAGQVPTFEGADQAHFQIPNRYLVLSTIGQVTGGSGAPGVGAASDLQTDAGGVFASGPLKISSFAQGVGAGSLHQELGMTLNVPAGVYPGEYDSTITVETYTGP